MKDKLLLDIANSTNLNFIANENALVGLHNGYNITINSSPYTYYITFPVKLTSEVGLDNMNAFLHGLTTEFKKLNYASYNASSIELHYTPKYRKYRKPEIILSIINKLIDFSITNNLVTCCASCGEETELKPFLFNNIILPCCTNCQLEINNKIAEQQNAFQHKSNNIIGGIVGGFIGALLGSVVWIGIAQMNYIAAIAGLAISICCIKGYQMFGGKLNLSGIVITSIITIIMVYLANHISLAIDIYSEYKIDYDINFFDALRAVPDFLREPLVRKSFIENLLIGYLFTAAASFSYIKKAYLEANNKIKFKEINM